MFYAYMALQENSFVAFIIISVMSFCLTKMLLRMNTTVMD